MQNSSVMSKSKVIFHKCIEAFASKFHTDLSYMQLKFSEESSVFRGAWHSNGEIVITSIPSIVIKNLKLEPLSIEDFLIETIIMALAREFWEYSGNVVKRKIFEIERTGIENDEYNEYPISNEIFYVSQEPIESNDVHSFCLTILKMLFKSIKKWNE